VWLLEDSRERNLLIGTCSPAAILSTLELHLLLLEMK